MNTNIYMLIDPRTEEPRYVGKANDPEKRLKGHLRNPLKSLRSWFDELALDALRPVMRVSAVILERIDGVAMERQIIAELRAAGYLLLNANRGGGGPTSFRHSPETCARLSAAKTGENHPMFGKHLSEETRARISRANIGKHLSEETRARISRANIGKHNSEEARAKNRVAHLGKHHSGATRAKLSAALTGRLVSEGTRAKLSTATKLYWARRPKIIQ